jgi:vancomycin resistance protein YoaR
MIGDEEMTLDVPDAGSSHARRRRIPSTLRAFLAVLVLGVAVVAVGLFAFEALYADRVVPGVRVGDVDLSGLDRPAAAARLDAAFASPTVGRIVVATPDGQHAIGYADIGRRPDLEGMLDEAFAIGHGADVFDRLGQTIRAWSSGISIPPRVTYDSFALRTHVAQVASLVDRPPRDAIVLTGDPWFTVQPAAPGQALRAADVTEAIARRVIEAKAATSVTVDAPITVVAPRLDDAAAERVRAAAERMAGSDLDLVSGDETWTIPASTVRSWIRFESAGAQDAPVVIPAEVRKAIERLSKKVGLPATNASVGLRGGRIVASGSSRAGRSLDIEATVAEILIALPRKAAGTLAESAPVEIVTRTVSPVLSSTDARRLARQMVRLSSWTTRFEPSERNGFGANIRIPARAIDGTVVLPGATFDFWDAVGSVTMAKGYRSGGAIINGRTQPTGALGGGICSTSTTLFNAAARAGLDIVSRRPHFYYIDRYPVGLDATVFISSSGSKVTLAFTNDTAAPILIRGSSTRTSVRFEVYGVPDGRTVRFSRPIVKNVVRARDVEQRSASIPAGSRKRVEYPTDGFDSWVTRTVKDVKGRVIHRDTFYSHYGRVDGVMLVGE